jgi:hypothetical protein
MQQFFERHLSSTSATLAHNYFSVFGMCCAIGKRIANWKSTTDATQPWRTDTVCLSCVSVNTNVLFCWVKRHSMHLIVDLSAWCRYSTDRKWLNSVSISSNTIWNESMNGHCTHASVRWWARIWQWNAIIGMIHDNYCICKFNYRTVKEKGLKNKKTKRIDDVIAILLEMEKKTNQKIRTQVYIKRAF